MGAAQIDSIFPEGFNFDVNLASKVIFPLWEAVSFTTITWSGWLRKDSLL
jgi:hypothetical protein